MTGKPGPRRRRPTPSDERERRDDTLLRNPLLRQEEIVAALSASGTHARERLLMRLQARAGNTSVRALVGRLSSGVVFRQAVATRRTQAEARDLVDAHVVPRDCFIWYVNNRIGWGPIPGTGCAHWVAHEMNITRGGNNVCQLGFTFRVRDLIAGMNRFPMAQAQVGDIWENPLDASHVGIVRAVETDPTGGAVNRAQVEHDSSRQGGVVTTWFTTGDFYR